MGNRAGSKHREGPRDDSSNWWWITKRVPCMPGKTHPSNAWVFFKVELILFMSPFKCKVSLKLMEFEGKVLTIYWCDQFFFVCLKAIAASLHKGNWFSSTNRLWIMPRGLVTLTLDCIPVEGASALLVCLKMANTHTTHVYISVMIPGPREVLLFRSDLAGTVKPMPRTNSSTFQSLSFNANTPAQFSTVGTHSHWRSRLRRCQSG